MIDYAKYIGKTFQVQGLNEPRTVKIKSWYYLCGKKKYPTFECSVQGNYKYFSNGERENFLVKSCIDNGKLKKLIKALTA